MEWIKSHKSLRTHPKVKRAARILGVEPVQAIGHLHCLWWWADDHAPDGDLNRWDDEDVADAAEWDGDPQLLARALRECGVRGGPGFVDPDGFLNDWAEYRQQRGEPSVSGSFGNHVRWHEERGVENPECPWCESDSSGSRRGDDPPDIGATSGASRGESGAMSPRRRGESLEEIEEIEKKRTSAHARDDAAVDSVVALPTEEQPADPIAHARQRAYEREHGATS